MLGFHIGIMAKKMETSTIGFRVWVNCLASYAAASNQLQDKPKGLATNAYPLSRIWVILGLPRGYGDNGKENGNYCNGLYRGLRAQGS